MGDGSDAQAMGAGFAWFHTTVIAGGEPACLPLACQHTCRCPAHSTGAQASTTCHSRRSTCRPARRLPPLSSSTPGVETTGVGTLKFVLHSSLASNPLAASRHFRPLPAGAQPGPAQRINIAIEPFKTLKECCGCPNVLDAGQGRAAATLWWSSMPRPTPPHLDPSSTWPSLQPGATSRTM